MPHPSSPDFPTLPRGYPTFQRCHGAEEEDEAERGQAMFQPDRLCLEWGWRRGPWAPAPA